ncbi:uncharacterized protein ATC70_000036 [Mucor velutinosus]|uniref:Uncharacterized protein n=1 Tax=Mucor velutinosus TaxID=708070 RepID=A0AAN7D5N9_9FUNG|nr:hypothetical protein ATC70_000036 [Mucor velutinosus]
MAPEKAKPVKKAVEAIKPSPLATRQQTSLATKESNSNEHLMQALKELFLPKFDLISSEIQTVQSNVQNRFQDLENAVDQINDSMTHLQVDLTQKQTNLEQQQLQQVLARVEQLEQEKSNPINTSAPSTFQEAITTAHQSSSSANSSNDASSSTIQARDHIISPPRNPKPQAPVDPLAGGLRYFTPVSKNQGFQHLFIPARGRRGLSSIRQLLYDKVFFKEGSAVDLHFPNSSTIGILVHNDYADIALKKLRIKGLEPITDFDPYHSDNLGNPVLQALSIEERTAKMKEIADKLYHTTLAGLEHKPKVQLAVARDFLRKNKITKQDLQDLIQLQKSTNRDITPNTSTQPPKGDLFRLLESEDDIMDEPGPHADSNDNNSTSMDAPAFSVHPSSAGGGEPASAL